MADLLVSNVKCTYTLLAVLTTFVVLCSEMQQPQESCSSISRRSAHDWEDLGLTVLAVLLSLLIAVIVLRKIIAATGGVPDVSMEADLASFE